MPATNSYLDRASQTSSLFNHSRTTAESLRSELTQPQDIVAQGAAMVKRLVETPYGCSRLNETTFVLVHNDKQNEHPWFYAKIHPRANIIVMIDTGSGPSSPADEKTAYKDIRQFIEEYPVMANGGRPLNSDVNEHGGKCERRNYLVINTHAHFDHIGGNECFTNAPGTKFVASGYDLGFLEEGEVRRKHSLCDEVGMKLPVYHIDKYAKDCERLTWPLTGADNSVDLGLRVLLTPGHTPDSLTLYDIDERHLFTGDTFYYRRCKLPGGVSFRQPIVFNAYSQWALFRRTICRLKAFVAGEEHFEAKKKGMLNNFMLNLQHEAMLGLFNRLPAGARKIEKPWEVKISCAHTTADASATEILNRVWNYSDRMAKGEIPTHEKEIRGENWLLWEETGDPEFSALAPAWLLKRKEEAFKASDLPFPDPMEGSHAACKYAKSIYA